MTPLLPLQTTLPALPSGTPAAMLDPRREIRLGGALIGLFVVGFLGWSAIAHLDAAVHSPGMVRVAGNRQAVQSLSGGIIRAIHVREGDRVKAGAVLVEFASTETLAQERSLASRVLGLQAEIARIDAERRGVARITPPAEWAGLTGIDAAAAQRALAGEQANLAAQRSLLGSQEAVLRQRIAQVGDQIEGYGQRQSSNTRQGALNRDELDSVNKLYQQGYATRQRVLALQRSAASIDGEIGATQAEMARLRTAAGENRLQIMQISDQRRQENADRMRLAQTELQTLLPQWKAAREQLEQTRLRAPVSGTVIGLAANTVGGVAAPGQKLMEIVPTDGMLVAEAQVAPADANDLQPGQPAEVRLSGPHGRTVPPLHGVVQRVSADSLVDEHSGRAFYVATVAVPRTELDKASREAGIDGSMRPGTPIEVIVRLKPRTALQYWIGPLTERFSPALSER